MKFTDIIGQKEVRKHLIESYQSGRTAHAQLFLGGEGSGGLALAWAYAQYLLCENPQPDDACGECNACRKVQKLIHPDLHFSFPTVGTGKVSNDFIAKWREALLENPYINTEQWLNKIQAEGAQGNINKAECVDIVRKFSFKAVEGRYKILIMWMPEFLEQEGNRLLKLIEEPEPNTVFILVAQQLELILNTVVSRCQVVKIPALPTDLIVQKLVDKYHTTTERAQFIAHLSDGNWNAAQSMLEDVQDQQAKVFLDWFRLCFKGHGQELVQWIDEVHSEKKGIRFGRKDQVMFLQYGLHFLRECFIIKQLADAAQPKLQGEELQAAQRLVQRLSVLQIENIMSLLDKHIYFIERNAHSKILFLSLSIELNKVFTTQYV